MQMRSMWLGTAAALLISCGGGGGGSGGSGSSTAPAAPVNLRASGGAHSVQLSWDTSPGASRYSIFQGDAAGNEAANAVRSNVTTSSVTLSDLDADTSYFFRVAAINSAGSSPLSAEVSATTAPAEPSGFTATPGTQSVQLQWNASAGASSYNVYQSTATSDSNPATAVNDLHATSVTVSGLATQTTYYFRVKAIGASGTSGYSSELAATTLLPDGMNPPNVSIDSPSPAVPFERVTLKGHATDADGSVVSYTWSQTTGPIVSAANGTETYSFVAPFVSAATDGHFTLAATDDDGLQGSASVTVPFKPASYYVRSSASLDPTPLDGPSIIAAGDFDGDGRQDFAFCEIAFNMPIKHKVRILLNRPGGFVEAGSEFFLSGPPEFYNCHRLLVADLNGDGASDLFISATGVDSSPDGERNGLLLSDGNGHMVDASSTLPNNVAYHHGASLGDVDGDGDIDIFVSTFNYAPGGVGYPNFLLINDGKGHFTANTSKLPAALLDGPYVVNGANFIGDVDGDGIADLVVADHSADYRSAAWFKGKAGGNFATSSTRLLPGVPLEGSNAAGIDIVGFDANRDGVLDLAITYYSKNFRGVAVQVLISDGKGNFTELPHANLPNSYIDEPIESRWIARLGVVDWNHDGWPDLFARSRNCCASSSDQQAAEPIMPLLWLNNGDMTFTPVYQHQVIPLDTDGTGLVVNSVLMNAAGQGRDDLFDAAYQLRLFNETHTFAPVP